MRLQSLQSLRTAGNSRGEGPVRVLHSALAALRQRRCNG